MLNASEIKISLNNRLKVNKKLMYIKHIPVPMDKHFTEADTVIPNPLKFFNSEERSLFKIKKWGENQIKVVSSGQFKKETLPCHDVFDQQLRLHSGDYN